MPFHYSNPAREKDPYALTDIEVFHLGLKQIISKSLKDEEGNYFASGWYYWFCFPGCLPDSEMIGAFASEQEALEDARKDTNNDG